MSIKQITPIMVVREIEPCLGFWQKLGFACVAEVPHGERLGFAILVKDGRQVMFQSVASVGDDLKLKTPLAAGDVVQYIDVDSLDAVIADLQGTGAEVLLGPRRTSYGAREIWVELPGGFVAGFAEHQE